MEKCPYCGSKFGCYVMDTVRRGLVFRFDGEPDGATEEIPAYEGKRLRCLSCDKVVGRRLDDGSVEFKS